MADRETIIETENSDDGVATGMAATIVVIVLLLIAGGYLVFSHTGSGTAITIDVPKVTVNAKG